MTTEERIQMICDAATKEVEEAVKNNTWGKIVMNLTKNGYSKDLKELAYTKHSTCDSVKS